MNEKEIREYAFLRTTFKYLAIAILWYSLEIWFYGCTKQSNEDTIIGLIMWYYIAKSEFLKSGVLPRKKRREG